MSSFEQFCTDKRVIKPANMLSAGSWCREFSRSFEFSRGGYCARVSNLAVLMTWKLAPSQVSLSCFSPQQLNLHTLVGFYSSVNWF